jgi:hypothetical protein
LKKKNIFNAKLFLFIKGFATVGAARLLNIYPFNITHKNMQLEEKQERS